ncbi:hypothetical protein FQZ97_545170 [compost metagenome]
MGNDLARGGLEHLLAAVAELEAGRDARRQLGDPVVEERHPRLQAPGHGHVVHPLHRVVHQHHRAVQAQGLVHRVEGAGLLEVLAHEVAGQVVAEPGRLHRGLVFGVAAVEEGRAILVERVAGVGQRRVPVVAAEQLVGALAALHHLAVLRYLAGEQVEGDAVVADHGFAHGGEGLGQLFQHLVLVDAQLLVAGAVVAGDQVGIFELVAALAAGILEADGEGGQLLHTGLGQQADQQAGIHAA